MVDATCPPVVVYQARAMNREAGLRMGPKYIDHRLDLTGQECVVRVEQADHFPEQRR